MAYKLQLKRGAFGSLPTGSAGEPLFTTDTNDLYIGTGAANQRFQKYIASGTSAQFLKGDGSLDSSTYALDSAVVKLTGNQTIGGTKTFNGINFVVANGTTSGSIDFGTSLQKGSIGYSDSIPGFIFNNAAPALAGIEIFQFQHENANVFSITKSGLAYFVNDVTATKFIKSGGTSSQYLMADGSTSTLTNPVTGTGTTNYLPKWTSGSALGNSLVYDDGTNVGIGTATPSAKIHVIGTESRFGGVSSGFISIYNAVSRSGYIQANGSTDLRIASDTDPMTLYVNGSERLRITSSGLIGIGTSSPAYKLDVSGVGRFTGDAANFLYLEKSANTGVYARWKRPNKEYILALDINNNGGNDFTIYDATANASRLTIDTSGNLGLGVVPSAWGSSYRAIDISGGAAIAGLSNWTYITANAYDNGTNWIYKSSSYATLSLAINGEQRWYTAPSGTAGSAITFTQAMTLDASGRLGIGTTSIGANLVVQNSSGTSIPSLGSTGGHFQLQNGSYGLLVGVSTSGYTWMQAARTDGTATAYALSVQSNGGNLLVGTVVDSGEKFQTVGTNKLNGNTTIGSATSADVFSRGYSGRILGISASGQSAIELNSSTGNGAYFDMGVNGTRTFGIYSDTINSEISTTGSYPLLFSTNAIIRLTIKTNGSINYQPMATPSSPSAGDVYYDSTSNKLRCYNGTSWNDLF